MMSIRFSFSRFAACLVSILIAMIGLFSNSARAHAQGTQIIYDDQLENGWQNWSWATVNFSNTSPVHSGSDSAAVSTNAANGPGFEAIWFHPSADMSTAGYGSVTFWLYEPSPSSTPLQVQGISGNNTVNGTLPMPTVQANTWTQETISLATLGCSNISNFAGFWIQSLSNSGVPTYYIDDVTLDTASTAAAVSVDANNTIGPIPPMQQGINTAVWDGFLTADGNTVPLLKAAGVRALRYPGGSESDNYHWATHQNVAPNDTFTWDSTTAFDPFITKLAQPLGVPPIITVNYGSNSSLTGGGDPNEAAAWVQYANVTKGYGVKYWEIGNEVYGNGYYATYWDWETDYHDTDQTPADRVGNANLSPTTYGQNVAVYSSAMKAVDPTIKIGAVLELPGQSPGAGNGTLQDWDSTVLQECGTNIDFVILHWYPESGTDNDASLLRGTSQIAGFVSGAKALINQYCGANAPNVQIFVTETNSDSATPGNQMLSPVQGIFMADNIQSWLEGGVANVEYWDLRNGAGAGFQDNGPLDVGNYGDEGILSNGSSVTINSTTYNEPAVDTPFVTYYAMQMLHDLGNPGDTMLNSSSNQSVVGVHAVKHADGSVGVLLLNRDPVDTMTTTVNVANLNPTGNATVYTYGPSSSSISTSTVPAASTITLAVPPYTLTTVSIPAVQLAPPSITNATISPATLPSSGGTITISTTVTDPNAGATLTSVTANVLTNGALPSQITLSNGGSGSIYTGTFNAPANTTNSGITYTATVSASDSVGQSSGPIAATGSTLEAPGVFVPPSITNATISPATLPPGGGVITVSATVKARNPGSSLSSVTANVLENGVSSPITMNFGGGSTYTGTFNAPANSTTTAITWTANISATDTVNQSAGPVAASGSTIQAGITPNPPVITNAAITPSSIPANGGTITISATVTDPNPGATLTSVTATLSDLFGSKPITLSNGGSGSSYTGTFKAPTNFDGETDFYNATVSATDSLGKAAGPVTASGQTSQLNIRFISIRSLTMSPQLIPSSGGMITVQANIFDCIPGVIITASVKILQNGLTVATIPLTQVGNSDNLTGTYNTPANTTSSEFVYTAILNATDNMGQNGAVGGTQDVTGTVQLGTQPGAPAVFSANMAPISINPNGDTLSFNAIVIDPNSNATVTSVIATLLLNSTTVANIPLTNQGGNLYSGNYVVPANNTSSANIYVGFVQASDSLGLSTNGGGGISEGATQPPVGAPVVTNPTMSSAQIPVAGGPITFSCVVTGANLTGVASVTALISDNTGNLYSDTLNGSGSGSTYTGTFQAPEQVAGSTTVYTATISAQNNLGGTSNQIEAPGSVIQSSGTNQPTITNLTVSPSTLAGAGAPMTVTATLSDPNSGATFASDGVVAYLLRNGSYLGSLPSTLNMSNGGSGNVYTATFTGAPNLTNQTVIYNAIVTAIDSLGISAGPQTTAVPTTQGPGAPSITNATISPATLPSSGGTVTVSATITDPDSSATLTSVTAHVLTNGASPSQITLSNGGSGSTYTGTFAAPANTTTTAITYTANVSASDSVSQSAGPVAATGSTVEAGITLVAPSITNATISPATLPVSGGTITVSATVTDSNPGATLSSVTANVSGGVGAAVASSGSQITLSNGGSGSTYTGTFSAAANTTTSAITYTANVSATDSDSQSAGPVAATGSSIEAGQPANFSITSASMSPATLAFAGGMITITANVVEPNQSATVTGVNVSLFKNGASYGGFKLTSAGGGVYSGSFGASQNLTGSSITYTATLSATDSVGKKASLPVSGSTVEASGSALSITSASMTPPTLTFQGGLITITASVSEPNSGAGVTGVNVSMFQNGASYGGFKLTSQGGGVYSGTFPAPKNVTGASQTYTASVKATDSAGLSATSAVSGSTVVPSGSALSIVSASMSPPTLSFSGGAITITANVNEPNASASITGVNVSMFQNGASFGGFKLSAQGGGVYSGVFGASKNLSGTALIYTATLKVTDSAGLNASAAVSGSTTEPSGSPLTITSASMSPANLTVSGGLMTFTVSVNEPNAGVTVSAVNISLFQNGGSYGGFKLSSAGGGVYTGSFPAPKNTSGVPIVYTATVKATDSAGLSATGAVAGSSTVAGP